MFRALRTLALLALLTGAASAAASDSYREARAELIAAYQAQDYAAMVAAADKALRARPGYPAARFNLALAYVLNGEPRASLEELESLLEAGIDFGVSDLDEFASVRTLPGWDRYEQGIRALREPTGETLVALERDDDRFVRRARFCWAAFATARSCEARTS
jgi:tetratricopeptide (TPR) repeat protein